MPLWLIWRYARTRGMGTAPKRRSHLAGTQADIGGDAAILHRRLVENDVAGCILNNAPPTTRTGEESVDGCWDSSSDPPVCAPSGDDSALGSGESVPPHWEGSMLLELSPRGDGWWRRSSRSFQGRIQRRGAGL